MFEPRSPHSRGTRIFRLRLPGAELRRWLPILILLSLCLLAARPLLSLQFFYSDDGLDHLLRLFAFDQTIHQGIAYPRWLFDLAFGFGYPIFDFYPPLAAFVAETLHLLGMGFVDALKGTDLLCIIVAALGAYGMGAEFFHDAKHARLAGFLTSVAYTFFPYFLIDIYARGAIAEALAAALLPWLIWSLRRGLREPTITSVLWTALLSALLLVVHSLTLLMVAPVLIAYVLLELFSQSAPARRSALRYVASSVLLGAGLSAIYWLPFIAELNQVKMGKGIASIVAVFSDHFLAPAQLVQLSPFYQYHDAPFELALVPVALGIAAIVVAALTRHRLALFFGSVSILAAVTMSEPLRGVWLAVPLATMVQYPWRVSILIGLGFSIAIGALPVVQVDRLESLTSRLPKFTRQPLALPNLAFTAVLATALIWSAIANLAPQQVFFPPNAPTTAQLARFEAYSNFVGTTTWGEYLPATIDVSNLLTYRAPQVQPSDSVARVQIDRWAGSVRAFHVSASHPISLSLRSFYFPGWQATVDGASTPTFPSTPLGLLTTRVPPGQHQVTFMLKDTLSQRAGTILSILSALVFVSFSVIAFRHGEKAILAAVGVFVLGLGVYLIPASAALAAQPAVPERMQINVSPQLDLVGLSIDNAHLQAGVWQISDSIDSLSVQTYWFTKSSVDEKLFIWRLVDPAGRASSQSSQPSRYDTGNPAAWVPNEIVPDHFDLPLSSALPVGIYALQVALGNAFVTVGSIDLARGSAPTHELNIAHLVHAHVGNQIDLLGYAAPQTARPGTSLPLTIYWQANQRVTKDYTIFVQLLDFAGNVAARPQHDTLPGGGLNPTSLWQPGALVADRQDFNLPRDLLPGLYRLIVGMYHYPNLTRLPVETEEGPSPEDVVTLGNIKVPMNAQNASPSHALNVSLGPTIKLNGYDFQVQPNQVVVKLYWQARTKIDHDYKVFVHISNTEGHVVAQQDNLPDAGRYPTRIWDAGEQIIDPYNVPISTLAAGRYTIFVGMYAPDTGERLPAAENGNELPDRQIKLDQFDVPSR